MIVESMCMQMALYYGADVAQKAELKDPQSVGKRKLVREATFRFNTPKRGAVQYKNKELPKEELMNMIKMLHLSCIGAIRTVDLFKTNNLGDRRLFDELMKKTCGKQNTRAILPDLKSAHGSMISEEV